jgi:AraC family transcriptional regulator
VGPRIRSRREFDLIEKQRRIESLLSTIQEELTPPPDTLALDLRRVVLFIQEHLFEPGLSVGEARRRCQLHNNNISSRFRCSMGLSPRDYIEAARMKAARHLLRHPDVEIYLIAMALGYEHQETFCRAFQRNMGCPPSKWREDRSNS